MRLCDAACPGISGWIAAKRDFVTMWEDVRLPDTERYTLVWETQVCDEHCTFSITVSELRRSRGHVSAMIATQTLYIGDLC